MKNRLRVARREKGLTMELMNMAENYYEQGKLELAINYYSQVIALEASQADLTYAFYMRGKAYQALGEDDQALKDWQQAQDLGFQHPWGLDLTGFIK